MLSDKKLFVPAMTSSFHFNYFCAENENKMLAFIQNNPLSHCFGKCLFECWIF